MVAGAAGRETGLASRILEASFRTDTPRMFAALLLLVLTGLALYALLEWAPRRLARRRPAPGSAAGSRPAWFSTSKPVKDTSCN